MGAAQIRSVVDGHTAGQLICTLIITAEGSIALWKQNVKSRSRCVVTLGYVTRITVSIRFEAAPDWAILVIRAGSGSHGDSGAGFRSCRGPLSAPSAFAPTTPAIPASNRRTAPGSRPVIQAGLSRAGSGQAAESAFRPRCAIARLPARYPPRPAPGTARHGPLPHRDRPGPHPSHRPPLHRERPSPQPSAAPPRLIHPRLPAPQLP